MKLYEITKEMQSLDELYLSCIDEETGEIKDGEILDELEQGIQLELKNKSAGVIKFFRNIDSLTEALDVEIKRLQVLKKSTERKADNFKKYIAVNMENIGIKKIETELGTLSLRKSKSVDIYDEKLIDKKFITTEIKEKISKSDIKKAIENGEEVQGANIVEKNILQIK